ncbi:hypothetical protein [Kribbella endophytica]
MLGDQVGQAARQRPQLRLDPTVELRTGDPGRDRRVVAPRTSLLFLTPVVPPVVAAPDVSTSRNPLIPPRPTGPALITPTTLRPLEPAGPRTAPVSTRTLATARGSTVVALETARALSTTRRTAVVALISTGPLATASRTAVIPLVPAAVVPLLEPTRTLSTTRGPAIVALLEPAGTLSTTRSATVVPLVTAGPLATPRRATVVPLLEPTRTLSAARSAAVVALVTAGRALRASTRTVVAAEAALTGAATVVTRTAAVVPGSTPVVAACAVPTAVVSRAATVVALSSARTGRPVFTAVATESVLVTPAGTSTAA